MEYTEADLRRGMGGESSQGVQAMDRLRILFSDGWTYTEADLQEDWAGEEGDGVEDLRDLLTDGWRLTLSDLDDQASSEDGTATASDALERIRSAPAASAGLTLVLALVLAALLAAAGLLGGQTGRGRLAWASGTLAIASLLLLLVATLSVNPLLRQRDGRVAGGSGGGPGQSRGDPCRGEGDGGGAVDGGRADLGGLVRNTLVLFLIGAVAFGLTFLRVPALSRYRR